MKKFNVTLGGLFNIRQAIVDNDIINLPFSRKGALAMARNMKKIDAELVEYGKERDELIRKYSDGGTSMDKSNPKWEEFVSEFNAISSVEATIDLNLISEDDLPENCSPAVCLVVDFMMDDKDNTEE